MAQGTLWNSSYTTLRSIQIKNFRLFRDLTIPRLGLVNLLVGRNNTGKSSVLEAVRLLVSEASPRILSDLLNRREENLGSPSTEDVSSLFCLFRRNCPPEEGFEIRSGEKFITANIRLLRRLKDDDIEIRYENVNPGEEGEGAELYLELHSNHRRRIIPVNEPLRTFRFPNRLRDVTEIKCVFVSTSGLSRQEFATFWSGVALTDMEDRINRCMRASFAEVDRITVVPGDRESNIIAKVRGSERPVALKSLGEGANRFFGLALAIANASNGVLLIDEVEIGVHFSIQIDLWRLLSQMALEFNVQIFTTTHSEDAIRAFSIATRENDALDGRLIRLQSRGGEIEAVDYDEEELWDVRDTGMEVR